MSLNNSKIQKQPLGPGTCITSNSFVIKSRFNHPEILNSDISSISISFDLRSSETDLPDIDVIIPQNSCDENTDLEIIHSCSSIISGVPYIPLSEDIQSTTFWETHTIIIDNTTSPNLQTFDENEDYFYISFYDNSGVSLVRNITSSITYNCDLPEVPSNLQGEVLSSSAISLNWPDVSEVNEYRVYKNGIYETSTSQSSATISNLQDGTTYSFAVTSVDSCGESDFSPAVSLTTEVETIVNFTISDQYVIPGEFVALLNTSSETFDSFEWSVPGGNPEEYIGENFLDLQLLETGDYIVTLTAHSSELDFTSSISKVIYVSQQYDCSGSVLIENGDDILFSCFDGAFLDLEAQANSPGNDAGADLLYSWKFYGSNCSTDEITSNNYISQNGTNSGLTEFNLPIGGNNCFYVEVEISTEFCSSSIASDGFYIKPTGQLLIGPENLILSGIHTDEFDNSEFPYFGDMVTSDNSFQLLSGAHVEVYFASSVALDPEFTAENGSSLIIEPAECYVITKSLNPSLELSEDTEDSAKPQLDNETNHEVNSTDLINYVSVFPNPSNGLFSIKLQDEKPENFSVEIYDSYGKRVLKQNQLNNVNEFNLSNLSKGIYYVHIYNLATNYTLKLMYE